MDHTRKARGGSKHRAQAPWRVVCFLFHKILSDPWDTGSHGHNAPGCHTQKRLYSFSIFGDRSLHRCICHQLLMSPARLGADTLECYSQLLATAAEQLRPAATAVLNAGLGPLGLAPGSLRAHGQAAGSAAGHTGKQQQRPARAEQPSLPQLQALLNEATKILTLVGFTDASGLPIVDKTTTSTTTSSSSSSDAPGVDAAHPALGMHARVQSSWVLEHWA